MVCRCEEWVDQRVRSPCRHSDANRLQVADNHDHDLYRSLRENAQAHNVLPRDKRLHRLMTYREAREDGLSHTKASKVCGVSQNRMRIWLQLWAPDGVDQAIEDETDDADAVREAA